MLPEYPNFYILSSILSLKVNQRIFLLKSMETNIIWLYSDLQYFLLSLLWFSNKFDKMVILINSPKYLTIRRKLLNLSISPLYFWRSSRDNNYFVEQGLQVNFCQQILFPILAFKVSILKIKIRDSIHLLYRSIVPFVL